MKSKQYLDFFQYFLNTFWFVLLMCCLTLFSTALCDSSSSVLHVRQTTDFFLDTNCRGNCSSISLWRVWIARGMLLSGVSDFQVGLMRLGGHMLSDTEEALVSFTRSNGCHAYVAERHYFSISSANLKDLFI